MSTRRRVIRGKTKYNKDWEAVYPWARCFEKDVYLAQCILCSCTIAIDSMGRSALKSHSDGDKHKTKEKAASKTTFINQSFASSSTNISSSEAPNPATPSTSTVLQFSIPVAIPSCEVTSQSSTLGHLHQPISVSSDSLKSKPLGNTNRMTQYLERESKTKAETI